MEETAAIAKQSEVRARLNEVASKMKEFDFLFLPNPRREIAQTF
jgi:hypothetical protein